VRDVEGERQTPFRVWLLPFGLLFGAALAIFFVTFALDAFGSTDPLRELELLLDPNPEAAAVTLSSAGEIVAAVLAIAITVVAIIVELAANRYTHRITELFVSEPTNFIVMGFFVITALDAVWVSLVFDYDPVTRTGFVPVIGIRVALGMLAVCLLILLPYFAFVFSFLNPVHIVERIRKQTVRFIGSKRRSATVTRKQREAVRGIEQIADVGLNAMENKDKGVSMASVDALYALVLDYQGVRSRLGDAWFRVDGELAHNPDFVSMAQSVHDDVTRRRIWFEMKVLRQYQTIYTEALNRSRDLNYVIAINTRRIAERAIADENDELLELSIKFFNTFLRSTINARDVRTAYNVLHQYRLLAETLLRYQNGRRSVEIARYFKYYSAVAFTAGLPFVLETAAYDLCTLNELAFDQRSPMRNDLLRIFLQVDKESETEAQETSLRGVRKAQVKLATYYLLKGDEAAAREVYRDMEREKTSRLQSIRDELLTVQSSDFWEISDRGVNFDYLSPDRKAKMVEFFDWFGDLIPPRASMLPMRTSDFPIPVPAEAAERPSLATSSDSVHAVPGVATKAGRTSLDGSESS
jgi:hypothetical protein